VLPAPLGTAHHAHCPAVCESRYGSFRRGRRVSGMAPRSEASLASGRQGARESWHPLGALLSGQGFFRFKAAARPASHSLGFGSFAVAQRRRARRHGTVGLRPRRPRLGDSHLSQGGAGRARQMRAPDAVDRGRACAATDKTSRATALQGPAGRAKPCRTECPMAGLSWSLLRLPRRTRGCRLRTAGPARSPLSRRGIGSPWLLHRTGRLR
jgi:hypothetical protein